MTTSIVKFQLRRDTSTNWTSSNATLSPGEPGVELDTGRMKLGIGAGPTGWNYLSYVGYTGHTGHTGYKGEIGPTGAPSTVVGPTGYKGETGPTGAPSTVVGPTGPTGPTGLGFTGPTGPLSNTNYTNTRQIIAFGQNQIINSPAQTTLISSNDNGVTWSKLIEYPIQPDPPNPGVYNILNLVQQIRIVKWNGSVWIAGGNATRGGNDAGRLFTSTNAIDWIQRTDGIGLNYGAIGGLDWNGSTNRWVLTGRNINTNYYYSDDNGATWIISSYNDAARTTFVATCVATNGTDKWLIGGSGAGNGGSSGNGVANRIGLLQSLDDGETWTNLDTGIDNTRTSITGIIWSGSLWVAIGEIRDTTNPDGITRPIVSNIIISNDGQTWRYPTSGYLIDNMFSPNTIAWNGSKFIIGGNTSVSSVPILITSLDGETWNGIPRTNVPSFKLCTNITWTGSLWIAVGGDSIFDGCIFTSIDGETWIERNRIVNIPTGNYHLEPWTLDCVYSSNVWLNNPTTIQDAIYKIENQLFKTNGYKLL